MEPAAADFVKASASTGTFAAAGTAIKAFALANPITLAGVAGVVIGVLGYRLLAHHDHDHSEEAVVA